MAKEPQELKWIESLLPEGEYRRKGMFGGFAYYIDGKIVLTTFENPGDRSYRDQTYDFEVWNGCMFPLEREHHEKALKRFPFLVNHPVLPKWLYLPLKTEGFDDLVSEVIEQIVKPTSYWGSIPKGKSKKSRSVKISEKDISVKMDTRKPRMFSDEPANEVLSKAVKISDLKNLGKLCEIEFRNAGIKTAPQFVKLGWKKALVKLIKYNPKNRHSAFAYMLVGALTNKTWNHISEEEKQEVRDFVRSLPKNEKPKKKK